MLTVDGESVPVEVTDEKWIVGAPCIHRGEQTRTVECESCKGSVKVKVFACDEYGECTLKLPAVGKVCYGCDDLSPK